MKEKWPVRVRLQVMWSSAHRPRLHWGWMEENILLTWLDWGDGNSNPVWSFDVEVRFPRWAADWLADHGVG